MEVSSVVSSMFGLYLAGQWQDAGLLWLWLCPSLSKSHIFHTCLASAWRNNKKAGHCSNAIKKSGKLLSFSSPFSSPSFSYIIFSS